MIHWRDWIIEFQILGAGADISTAGFYSRAKNFTLSKFGLWGHSAQEVADIFFRLKVFVAHRWVIRLIMS